jgi:hypothetical protein
VLCENNSFQYSIKFILDFMDMKNQQNIFRKYSFPTIV